MQNEEQKETKKSTTKNKVDKSTTKKEIEKPTTQNEVEKSKIQKHLGKIAPRWLAITLLIGTFMISIVTGYVVCDNFFWKTSNEKKLIEQIEGYKAQVAKTPNDPNTRVQLGFRYFRNGDIDEAISQYKTAINLNKDYYPAYLNLAILYDSEDDSKLGLENATKAAELNPQDYLAHLIKGSCFRKLKSYDKALDSLQQAQILAGGNVEIMLETGRVAEDQGKYKEAKEIYDKAATYDPTRKETQEAISRVNKKIGK